MEKQKKVSKAKQRIVDNYERQKADFEKRGYKEYSEVFSAAKANAMVFVTSFPVALILILIWVLTDRGPIWTADLNFILVLALVLVTAYIHEVLHGVGWCLGTKEKWKSIYIGMMWSSLTPYCHCKEPLEPGSICLAVCSLERFWDLGSMWQLSLREAISSCGLVFLMCWQREGIC